MDLLEVGKHYNLDVKQSLHKDQIKSIVVEYIVDDDIRSDGVLQLVPITTSSDAEVNQLEMELHYQLERDHMQLEINEKEETIHQ